jgi:hypothetical protein
MTEEGGCANASQDQAPRARPSASPSRQEEVAVQGTEPRIVACEIPISHPGKEAVVDDLNLPQSVMETRGEATTSEMGEKSSEKGTVWSPEKIAGKKRMGSIIVLSNSETGSEQGT